RQLEAVALAWFLREPAACAVHDGPDELKVWMRRLRCEVMLEHRFPIQPLGEGLVTGGGGIERAGADEDDGCVRVSESNLWPSKRPRQGLAGAVSASSRSPSRSCSTFESPGSTQPGMCRGRN